MFIEKITQEEKRQGYCYTVFKIWMNLIDNILGKISQTQEYTLFDSTYKSTYRMISYCIISFKKRQN